MCIQKKSHKCSKIILCNSTNNIYFYYSYYYFKNIIHIFIPADLASVLEAANELLLEWRASKAPKQNWGQRSTILNESWVSLRETLMNTTVSGYAVNETSCMKCSEHVAVVRCYDCHIHTRLCGHCHQLIHEMQPFHDRDGSTGGFWKPIPPIVSLDCDGQWISVGM